ncbi:MAG: ABC transporter permease subunit [Planctomycetota bacterium]|nr:ABC transporter permease subunit [Planctomycetota bacterium]
MSRPLVLLALVALFVLGLAPVLALTTGLGPEDLMRLFEQRTLSLLGRTIRLGLGTAAIALFFGIPFGFLVARTDTPGAGWLRPLGAVPLFLPTLFVAIAWSPLVELRGGPAATITLGLSTFPLVGLFTARAFERIDARREEAALLAGGLGAVLRMELPLVLPAALTGAGLAFAFAINDFATPDYVSSVGPKFNVYADEVFATWNQLHEPGTAVATALPLILLTLLALLPALSLRRRGSFATLDSGFRTPSPLRLGLWRWPALAFCLVPVSLGALIPLGRLTWEAAGMPAQAMAAEGYSLALASETFGASVREAIERCSPDLLNSIVYSGAAALIAVVIGLVLGHAIERGPQRLRRPLEVLGILPLAFPAVLFGIGAIHLWSRPATMDLYDSPTMAVMLFVGRYLAFPILLLAGAVAAMDRRQEESAALAGVGPTKRLGRIVAPQLGGSLIGSFVLVFVFCMRELDSAILVPAANHTAILRVFNGVHFGRSEYVAALALLLVFTILLPGLLWTLFSKRRLAILP